MKKYLSVFVAMMVAMFSFNAFAYTPPPAPANGGYVVDQAGKLSPDQIDQLNKKIDQISKATKNEFGILLLQNMDDENIEDVAHATYNTWGIGKKGLDNGCLIVVAVKERKSRIETGKGVEGEVTDLQASDVLKKNLNPHLKNGDFAGGFNDTLDALSGLMESRQKQKANASTSSPSPSGCQVADVTGSTGFEAGIAVVVGVLCLLMVSLFVRSKRRQLIEQFEKDEEENRKVRDRLAKSLVHDVAVTLHEAKKADKVVQAKKEEVVTKPVVTKPVVTKPVVTKPITVIQPVVTKPITVTQPVVTKPVTVPRPDISDSARRLAEELKTAKSKAALASAAAATTARMARERKELERQESERNTRNEQNRRNEEDKRRRQREEDDRRRQREEDDRRSSSSSSSYDYSSSSSSSSSGSDFGGFGGGDSGGGGSSSDW